MKQVCGHCLKIGDPGCPFGGLRSTGRRSTPIIDDDINTTIFEQVINYSVYSVDI